MLHTLDFCHFNDNNIVKAFSFFDFNDEQRNLMCDSMDKLLKIR